MPQNCQGHQKQRKSEKLSQPRRAQRDMMTKCNMESWIGFWNRKGTLSKNGGNLNEAWTYLITKYQY